MRCKVSRPKNGSAANTGSRIAKYTGENTHLNRCSPCSPDPHKPLKEAFSSPRLYYSAAADSIPDPKTARMPISRSSGDMEPLYLQTSPQRVGAAWRSAIAVAPPVDQAHLSHIAGHEPKIFPGVVHERARRRSLRASMSGSDMSAGVLAPALAKMRVAEAEEEQRMEEASE
jgi:hypothetical protein